LDSPQIADFVAGLQPINELADASPGFVWRLQTEDGDATSVRPLEDNSILVNMSVWESMESLAARSGHAAFMRWRRESFQKLAEAHLVLWWVPAGHIPTVQEAKERLELLLTQGPAPRAFTFQRAFSSPLADAGEEFSLDRAFCPT
jgi:Domain of unknown function (DUF3291)